MLEWFVFSRYREIVFTRPFRKPLGLLPTFPAFLSPAHNPFKIRTYEKTARNPFRIRTSKTKDLKPTRINTYEKTPGGRGTPAIPRPHRYLVISSLYHPIVCFHTLTHSFAPCKTLSPISSMLSALFAQITRVGYPCTPRSSPGISNSVRDRSLHPLEEEQPANQN
jgi:hypothetical protein